MPLNINDLENRIQQKIDGLTTANSSIEFVIPSMTEVSNVKSFVANTASLPNIYTDGIPNGTVVYVESLGVPVIASKCAWLGLDGRLLQKDVEFGLWSWGEGFAGKLGDNTVANKSSPISVVGGFTDWCQVSTAYRDSAVLRNNGTIWTWGQNTLGVLGDGTGSAKSSPVSVVGGFTDWCQVSISSTAAAIRTNGTLWTWGPNDQGQLGNNSTVDRCSPVSVVGGFTDWCQVSAAHCHSVAIRNNGTLWTWGNNLCGQLGDNSVTSKSSPVSVVGGFTDWCQVSATRVHTVALRTNGTLWAWGCNGSGRLGDNTDSNRSSPVSVVGGFTDWCQVSTGFFHSAAVRTNGTLWTWGNNQAGQLGDGSTFSTRSPVSVIGGFTDWCQVSSGQFHTVATRTNGTLWSWGSNVTGNLGDGTTVSKSSPVSVIGGFTDWCQVSAGSSHTVALRACIL